MWAGRTGGGCSGVCAFLRSARPCGRRSWRRPMALAGRSGSPPSSGYPGWTGDPATPGRSARPGVPGADRTDAGGLHGPCGAGALGAGPPKPPAWSWPAPGPDILDAHSVSERAPWTDCPITPCCWPGRWRPFGRAAASNSARRGEGKHSSGRTGRTFAIGSRRLSGGPFSTGTRPGPAIGRVCVLISLIQNRDDLGHAAFLTGAQDTRAPVHTSCAQLDGAKGMAETASMGMSFWLSPTQ